MSARCAEYRHLENRHGIDFELLRLLIDSYLASIGQSRASANTWSELERLAGFRGESACEVVGALVAEYLKAEVMLPPLAWAQKFWLTEHDSLEELEIVLDYFTLPSHLREPSVDNTLGEKSVFLKMARSNPAKFRRACELVLLGQQDRLEKKAVARAEFRAHLPSYAQSEITGSIAELINLIYFHQGCFSDFRVRKIFELLFENYYRSPAKTSTSIATAVRRRDELCRESLAWGGLTFLTHVRYLAFQVTSEEEAKEVIEFACRNGDIMEEESESLKSGTALDARRARIQSALGNFEDFRKAFLPLWKSQRCQLAWKEFHKKAGDPWDLAIKY